MTLSAANKARYLATYNANLPPQPPAAINAQNDLARSVLKEAETRRKEARDELKLDTRDAADKETMAGTILNDIALKSVSGAAFVHVMRAWHETEGQHDLHLTQLLEALGTFGKTTSRLSEQIAALEKEIPNASTATAR